MDDSRLAGAAGASQDDVREGVRNLLSNAAKVEAGANLLIINATDGSIEREMAEEIETGARDMGARVHVLWCDKVDGVEDVPPLVRAAFEAADVTIFNHRISSMLRLMPLKGGNFVSNFFTTRDGLGSPAARTPMAYWRAALRQVQDRVNKARNWRIVCPDGTDLRGSIPVQAVEKGPSSGQTFSTVSFPIGIFKPLPTGDAHGTVALRWLATSGIHFDGPSSLALDAPVLATVKDGRFVDFAGEADAVEQMTSFLRKAGEKHGKDGYLMNGWHAGINCQMQPNHAISDGVEKWLFNGHQSPRVVHFHLVGTEPPGEYSAACLDPTIEFDGETMWRDGRLVFAETDSFCDAVAPHGDPGMAAEFHERLGA